MPKKHGTEQAKEHHGSKQDDVESGYQDFGNGGAHGGYLPPLTEDVGSVGGKPVLADDVAYMQNLSACGIQIHLGDAAPAYLFAQFLDGRGKELVSVLVDIEQVLSVHFVVSFGGLKFDQTKSPTRKGTLPGR